MSSPIAVKVPEQFLPIFQQAQEYVKQYFEGRKEDPLHGTIDISGERYIFVRAASLSVDFFGTLMALYSNRGKTEAYHITTGFLFDIAHAVGKSDAAHFHAKMGVSDPVAKLSAGPIHFAYSGWAFVDILPESAPSPDENYFLIYDHPYSFEADAWMKRGVKTSSPVCIMNAGYSSGWCAQSFGIPLVAVEIECRAKGDEHCRFIMAPPSKIKEYVSRYMPGHEGNRERENVYVPEFFQRKQLEDALNKSREHLITFTGQATHDLKKPLAAIKTSVSLLLSGKLGVIDDKQKKALDLAATASGYMELLIQELLDLARVDAGRLELSREKVNFNDLVRRVSNLLSPVAEETGVEIVVHPLPEIHADPAMLEKILMNLVGNAIIYKSPDRPGRVDVGVVEGKTPLTIFVKDNGLGIPEKVWGKIFERFSRGEHTAKIKGTGLGLSIVKGLVEAHGGKVWLESTVGEGTTFFFTLEGENG